LFAARNLRLAQVAQNLQRGDDPRRPGVATDEQETRTLSAPPSRATGHPAHRLDPTSDLATSTAQRKAHAFRKRRGRRLHAKKAGPRPWSYASGPPRMSMPEIRPS